MTFDELKQLDPKDPGRWPLPVRIGAIALFFVLASALLLWFGVWNRSKDELARHEADEVKLRAEFKEKHGKAVNLELYKAQLVEIERNFGAMLRSLPNRTEMQGLIQDISQSGNGVVQEQLFQPQGEVLHDFYAEQPIRIRVAGNYHELAGFVSSVADLPRIVTMHDVAITTSTGRGASGNDLQMDVTARTYRYLDDEEQAQKAQQKKAESNNRKRR